MCNKKDFTGVRYICGVCSDYNLCEDCERNPSGEEHDKTHIFLKLKRVLHETVPSGPLLIEGAIEMGKAMDFTRDDHQVFESVSDSQFRITSRVSCDRCAKVGKGYVKGDCYYCGYCTDYMLCSFCEKRSTIIHDPLHIFLKVKHTVNKNIDSARNVSLLKNRLN
ncbi:uncharacterized protein [Watersipora subatra]|uniref:uncharacterized protein n=1 Tax=Watersipora subatra TaxID=2589382 RepID=UPI00355C7511